MADDKAAAESAFLRGKELLKAGKTAEACDSFARSEKLDPQMGTRYNLALCYEQEGRLASAWGLFRELAQRDSNGARKKDSTTRAAALAPRLTKMLINLEFAAVQGLVVTRNGEDVTATVGIESPVDPGDYAIVANAPGYVEFTATVSARGEGMTVTVSVPSLEKKPETTTDAPIAGAPALPPVGDDDEPIATGGGGSSRKTIGIVVGGTGVAAAAGGVVFGLLAQGKWNDAKAICGDDLTCDTQDQLDRGTQLTDKARTYGNVSTVLVGVGAAAIVTGAILWLTAPDDETPDEHAWRVIPSVGPDGAYVTIGGAL